jgi:glycosyltransferase involved in cell wall biosynthesis
MKHLIISRELPPAPYAAGGIGTYVANIARLLAESGEIVHVIGERWDGAPKAREVHHEGRLVIHRIAADDVPQLAGSDPQRLRRELQGLKETAFPEQWFAWSAAFLAERLIEEEGIDVVEAQEWEAPLYYFLLRRSLGLGPERRPPCLVHLHSPTVFIHHYNGPPVSPASLPWMRRLEEFCIQSADSLLCPSRRLARDACRHYQLATEAIEVIPLPVGFAAPLVRAPPVWEDGSICYVGRLEPRKGVIEWIEAASRVAREDPNVSFDLIGADIWNLRGTLEQQVGPKLAARFRFHGPKSKDDIQGYLARAQAAVVPSRWENFPNVCIEAMASGLPVITTPYGGQAEMVEDGQTGWMAADLGVAGLADSLADALRACIATPPERKAAMGAAAADSIRRYCDNQAILASHLRFRAAVAGRGAQRSTPAVAADRATGGANIVIRADTLSVAQSVLRSIERQSVQPAAVAVICRINGEAGSPGRMQGGEFIIEHAPNLVGAQAWNRGFELLASRATDGFWLFLDEHDALDPDCLERMAAVFAMRPDVGIVTPWTERTGWARAFDARPSPAFPYQMTGNDAAPASGFRARALGCTAPFRPGLPREHDVWALSNAVIAGDWNAVTLPALLARRHDPPPDTNWAKATALRAIRAEALKPFDTEANRLALELVHSHVPPAPPPTDAALAGGGLRRCFLRYLEAVLLRPEHVLKRLLAATPGLWSRGAAKL